jgi:threonylcarbamoyladenosine tRNA methylthiotransferase MtaB
VDYLSSFDIKTYGCKVNTYDSGLLEKRLEKFGWTKALQPKIHLLNTCAVTQEATQEAVREVRRLKNKDPNCVVVVTGCAAQVDTEKFSDVPADLVIANSHKGQLEELIEKHLNGELSERVFKSNIFKKEDLEAEGGTESSHTRSFLKIQDGCNSFCTFCVIPFARGKSRSLTIETIRNKVNEFYDQGMREVVLTGIHIGDYEFGLENLIEDLLHNTSMPRFRLGSLEPVELTDRLLALYESERMCRHFHMSIQSATTSTLQRMKRQYTADDVERALRAIQEKVPGAYVGMDVIAGFVGETEEDFQDTFLRLAQLPWTRMHVFPYSERPSTFAIRLEGKVPAQDIARRAERLRELSLARFTEIALQQVGSTKQILALKSGAHAGSRGLSRDYWNIEFSGAQAPNQGEELAVTVTGYRQPKPGRVEGLLLGHLAN